MVAMIATTAAIAFPRDEKLECVVRGGEGLTYRHASDRASQHLMVVEDWLRVEGYAYRFHQKRWRVWARPCRPGEGLRPDGIDEDENPIEFPSGATIDVSMWDMIEKNFPEPGNERTLQGSNSTASLGKERRSAGDKKRDKKWREYQESLAAKAVQAAENETKGGTPAPSPQRASGHPDHTTLGDFLEVAKKAKAKPCQLHLRKSDPSSDVELAHRWRMPADKASSSSSAAPDQMDVARACERACGVSCNLRVARQRATQQNAAAEGAVSIAQEEAADWGRGMALHASTVAAIAAGLAAAAAQEEATAWVRGEVAAAAQEARLAQEAIVRKKAEVKALEEALAEEGTRKEAEERAHAEATAKAQADAARKDAIKAARRKVADERAKTEAELAGLEAGKARLQRAREAKAARAPEEAERRAAAATAAATEEAEAKLQRETRPRGSRVETLRNLFEGDASSKMTLDLEDVDTGCSEDSGPNALQQRRGKGKTPERTRRPAGGHPNDPDPFFTASDGDGRDRRHRRGVAGGGGGDVPMEPEGGDVNLPPPYRSSESTECETETAMWGDMDEDDDMDFGYTGKPPSSDPPKGPGRGPPGPPGGGSSGPPGGRAPGGPPGGGPPGGGGPPRPGGPGAGPPAGPPGDPDGPPEEGDQEATWRWIVHLSRRVQTLEREVDTGKGEMISIARVAPGAQKELDIARTEMVKIAKVATVAQRELDIARGGTRLLKKVINGLQQRLDKLEGRGSVGSDHPPLESGSLDNSWGPGPGPGRAHAPGRAPRSSPSASAPSLSAPSHHSAGRRNERMPPSSGSEDWRDEWLSAEYHNRQAAPVRPRRPAPAQEAISMAGGQYGGLRDEVPRGDVEWDVGRGEEPAAWCTTGGR